MIKRFLGLLLVTGMLLPALGGLAAAESGGDGASALTGRRDLLAELHREGADTAGQIREVSAENRGLLNRARTGASRVARDAVYARLADLFSRLSSAYAARDRESVKEIHAEISAVRREVRAFQQAARQAFQALTETLAPLRDQAQALQGGVRSLRSEAREQQSALRQAWGDRDEAGALTALDRLTTLERQANALLKQILQHEQEVNLLIEAHLRTGP